MASGNITAVFFILLSVVTGQACTGFLDYSSGIVKCVEKCASNSQNIGDICCSPSQYFYNGSCRVCSGWVVNAGRDCCHYGYYYSNELKRCRKCAFQTYLSGKLCCSGCEYVDMSSTPICVANGQGSNPNLTCTSLQKIWCPNQQYFYIPQQACKDLSFFEMNCDSRRKVCCKKGFYIDYVNQQLSCVQICTYGVRIDDSTCANKYCTKTGQVVLSLSASASNLLVSNQRRCCLSYYPLNDTCFKDSSRCAIHFKYNLFSICCEKNRFFDLQQRVCLKKCISIISVRTFCIPAGSFIDFSSGDPQLKQPIEVRYCNGVVMPIEMTICCPRGQYVDGENGCTGCFGRIFGTNDYQVCCSADQIYNPITKQCSLCNGTIDSAGTLCCPVGEYVSYNTDGTRSCFSQCPQANIRNGSYCCQMCLSGCSTKTLNCSIPKLCSPSYFVPKSCSPCECGTCESTISSQFCTSCGSNLANLQNCVPICSQRKVLSSDTNTCLDCDVSCGNCTQAIDPSKCVKCRRGFALSKEKVCKICRSECRTCDENSGVCSSCNKGGQLPVFFGNNCVYSCYYGNYIDKNGTCSPCSPNCFYCSDFNQRSCTSCYNGSYLSLPEGSCFPCKLECLNCADKQTCTSCKVGSLQNGQCVEKCSIGFFQKNLRNLRLVCQACYPGCVECANAAINCVSCKPNFQLDTSQGNGNCVPCPTGCLTCNLAGECVGGCRPKFFSLDDNKTCMQCDRNCATCNQSSKNDCLSCEPGLSLVNGTCQGCSLNCYQCKEPTVCLSCRPGLILNNDGVCKSDCPDRFFQDGNACKKCFQTCKTCQLQHFCTSCLDQYPYFNGDVCVAECPFPFYPNKFMKRCQFCNGNIYMLGTQCCQNPFIVVKNTCIDPKLNNTQENNTIPKNDTNQNNKSNNNSNNLFEYYKTPQLNQHEYVHKQKIYLTLQSKNGQIETNDLKFELLTDYNSNSSYLLNYTIIQKEKNYLDLQVSQPSQSYNFKYLRTTYKNQQWYSIQLYNQFRVTQQYSHNSGLKAIGIICSIILVIYSVACKCKSHYEAEEANRLVLHSLNFCQIVGLFRNVYFPSGKLYNFLQGFRWSHWSFFYNAFKAILPSDYIQPNQPNSLQPDACLIRNAGFSITLELFLIGILVLALIGVYSLYYCKQLEEPPFIRLVMRVFICLFSMTWMNLTFYAIAELRYHKHYERHHSIYNSNFVASIFVIILIPIFLALFSLHNFLTYLTDQLQHLYSLRELSQLLQIFLQGIIMGLSIQKYYTVFLIGIQLLWFLFNILLWTDIHWTDNIKHYVTEAAIIVGYILLIVGKQANIGTIVVISLIMTLLIVYCTYQIVGLYYWDVAAVFGYYEQNAQIQGKLEPEAIAAPSMS